MKLNLYNSKGLVILVLAFVALLSSEARAQSDQAISEGDIELQEEIKPSRKVRVDRQIESETFVSKGSVMLGTTLSYTSLSSSDYKFLLFQDLTTKSEMMGGELMVGYAFADNVAAGLSFKYSRNMITLGNVNIDLSEDLNFSIKDYATIQQLYTATAFLRTYINLGKSKRFAMFNDIKAYFGGGQGKFTTGATQNSNAYVGTYEKINKMGLLLQPGITVFATDFMAIEASMAIFGVEYSRTEQITNQVYQGSIETFNASLKLNLLSVDLGMTIYF